jgi:serine protease inhibitor ecotin
MNIRLLSAVLLSTAALLTPLGRAGAAPIEIKGAAILDHPCGKVAVKHMGLAHAGKMDEATRLDTQEMQDKWKSMPAADRKMMSEMMKEMSKTEAQLSADIKAGGVLAVDGNSGTLTIKREHKDANGSSTETWTQRYVIDGAKCLVAP